MLSIIQTLDTARKPVNVKYRYLQSIGIITERQVDSCRKYFKGNYNMLANSLVIMYRIELSRRNSSVKVFSALLLQYLLNEQENVVVHISPN